MTPHFHRLAVAEVRRGTLRAELDGEELRRSYSICSGLDDGELRVAVKRLEGGRFSSFVNEALRPGDALDVMTPMGRFGLAPDPAAARTHVGLACGSGITPVLSLVKSMLSREPGSRFFLFYGNRTSQSIMFREALEELKDRHLDRLSVFHVLSREAQDIPVLNGRLDGAKISLLLRTVVPAVVVDHAFICGPGTMIEEAEATLKALGVPGEIHIERFTPAEGAAGRPVLRPVPADAPPRALAEIVLDGRRYTVPVGEDEGIVDAALRAGLELPYACKGGMCCPCRAKIVEGRVEMRTNYSLEPWEIEAGYALTCQARPITERVVVDYDQ